jgi:2-polyprenyl-6-methoxyphenol hydroxylase-like FAD-dependent oxidoreductase
VANYSRNKVLIICMCLVVDIRKQQIVAGRSINLALSCRGREALRHAGLEDQVTANGIPMYGRMIHDLDGRRRPIPYGRKDQVGLQHELCSSIDKYMFR